LRVVSTPNGKQNKFYELITSQDNIWSKHIVSIYDAINQGLNRDIAELRSAINDEDAWKQEYELEWLDEASAWLDYDLIHSTEDENAGDPLKYEGNPVFIGNDIAIRNDLWVAWVIEQIGDVLWTREVIAKQRISFSEQDRIMDSLFKKYKVARLCMDATGIGEKPVEDATRRYGKNIVEGVTFTSSMKLVLATVGKQAFESKRIRIPKNDNALVNDLHKIKKSVTATGASRFVAESDSTGHADRAWACFLACYAANSGKMVYDWKTVNSKPGAW
jgi:phage FluMu gp28-like protein